MGESRARLRPWVGPYTQKWVTFSMICILKMWLTSRHSEVTHAHSHCNVCGLLEPPNFIFKKYKSRIFYGWLNITYQDTFNKKKFFFFSYTFYLYFLYSGAQSNYHLISPALGESLPWSYGILTAGRCPLHQNTFISSPGFSRRRPHLWPASAFTHMWTFSCAIPKAQPHSRWRTSLFLVGLLTPEHWDPCSLLHEASLGQNHTFRPTEIKQKTFVFLGTPKKSL